MDPDVISAERMMLSYKGPLSGLLDEIASHFGIWWKYERGEIYFYKFITRTFVVYSLPTSPSLSVSVGGSASGDGGDASVSLSNSADMNLWGGIEASITAMVDSSAKINTDPANGTITLTATPNDIRRVARFINEKNTRLSRQVAISVKVFQVAISDSDQFGLNFSALFSDTDSSTTVVGGVRSIPGLGGTDSLAMAVSRGNWSVDSAVQALSRQGTTTLVTSGTITTLNNKPAPIQVVRRENYIAQITRTNSGGTSDFYDISTDTKEISTGFTMDVLPRILEHGRMLLMFNLTLSDLIALEKVMIGEEGMNNFIQNPVIESRGFTQEVAMRSGESLILTGFERVENAAVKTGVGSASNSLLGGTATAAKTRTVLVIILTPVVLASPLSPESRMRNH
jgi:type IVB pilus formation R64 PilN family outer membrane protein